MYHFTTQLFYQLANAFFWPVAIALLALFAATLIDLGALLVQIWRRQRQVRTDMTAVAQLLLARAKAREVDALASLDPSPALRRFWTRVRPRLIEAEAEAGEGGEASAHEHIDLWLEDALQEEELAVTSRLDLSRVLIRIGPMLGLAGTIIPLGPALESLLAGSMADMVGHLVIGFGAVVVGLVLSGVSYFTTLVRERWMRRELKDLETLCELIMRGIKAAEQSMKAAEQSTKTATQESAYARV